MDFVAGAIGGGVSAAVGYPLDTIKVRIQTEAHYRGIWHCMRYIYKTERVPGFFKGISMTVLMASLISSFSFGIYKNFLYSICRLRYGSADRKPSKMDISFAGCVTGALRVVLISPAEIAKVRLQIQKEPYYLIGSSHSFDSRPKYQGSLHCLRTIIKEEGLADLWAVLLSGGCAGVLAWGTATPMDVIKARMQADGDGQRKYTGLVHCVRDSIKEEGLRVLFKGLGLNSLRAFPSNMMIFLTYETVLRFGKRLEK
ncbi:solute carrier family 25 member 47 isoform X1 [Erythrolamprus reginae]|uniref:solute carrier family 25 member 47 isoform X1 n=1 Tax=Erythrolamprus reginae TaxID=121349 RepID=UPI00396CB7B3